MEDVLSVDSRLVPMQQKDLESEEEWDPNVDKSSCDSSCQSRRNEISSMGDGGSDPKEIDEEPDQNLVMKILEARKSRPSVYKGVGVGDVIVEINSESEEEDEDEI